MSTLDQSPDESATPGSVRNLVKVAKMDTLTSAQTLTSADPKQNRHDIQNHVVTPTILRYRRDGGFSKIALAALLLAFTITASAQSQQVTAANVSANNPPHGEVAADAGIETQPATTASNSAVNQP